jgi:hypothetical protein
MGGGVAGVEGGVGGGGGTDPGSFGSLIPPVSQMPASRRRTPAMVPEPTERRILPPHARLP